LGDKVNVMYDTLILKTILPRNFRRVRDKQISQTTKGHQTMERKTLPPLRKLIVPPVTKQVSF
jgi:hypothetical protein